MFKLFSILIVRRLWWWCEANNTHKIVVFLFWTSFYWIPRIKKFVDTEFCRYHVLDKFCGGVHGERRVEFKLSGWCFTEKLKKKKNKNRFWECFIRNAMLVVSFTVIIRITNAGKFFFYFVFKASDTIDIQTIQEKKVTFRW